ncbi:HTH-type transcriptional regulator ImmR [Lentilactobacillus parabuchneri]|uniref:helix-turn-helix domain-containing protein n=1 Tax=Lentilactobacillus parabuchneri TaxID=152331 RepID=UPI000A25F731|nr:helix-turn-helix transcriptional regulator [Lentilactobacillus parabuchneri]MDB1104154.1 helix-turn-helix transcriptional regulator [Lentilactobacillus parabuchneri]ORN10624.1 HTH-type transcriptional regulator ImmR [Lentilactobacillus parabuchneri]
MADKSLANKIVNLREEGNITQSELARRLGLDKSSMSKIESGSRKVSTDELKRISEIFEVSTDYLLGNTTDRNGHTPSWATNDDKKDLKRFLEENANGMTYGGEGLTDEEQKQVRRVLEGLFWDKQKQKNNRK